MIDLDVPARERVVRAVLAELARGPLVSDPRHELVVADVATLHRGGFDLSPIAYGGPDDPLAQTIADYMRLIETALSVTEAAQRLGVNPSRVRQRLAARTLYGIKRDGEWRLPAFQFTASGEVPRLSDVLPLLDPGLDPVSIFLWFTSPDADLEIGGQAVSPRDWLLSGRSPDPVAALAHDL